MFDSPGYKNFSSDSTALFFYLCVNFSPDSIVCSFHLGIKTVIQTLLNDNFTCVYPLAQTLLYVILLGIKT